LTLGFATSAASLAQMFMMAFATVHPQEAMLQPTTFEILLDQMTFLQAQCPKESPLNV
jgi:hypothetical protein